MPSNGITAAPLPHSHTAREQSCERAQSCSQQPSHTVAAPGAWHRIHLRFLGCQLPHTEGNSAFGIQLCQCLKIDSLRIHIFSALVIMDTNIFLSQRQKIWCCLEGLSLAVPRSTARVLSPSRRRRTTMELSSSTVQPLEKHHLLLALHSLAA